MLGNIKQNHEIIKIENNTTPFTLIPNNKERQIIRPCITRKVYPRKFEYWDEILFLL